ncbi:uncharacterized protein ec isoform X1 [Centruroides vittatus]|uniref:uncharacterized protein ec isoform X1 n=2 Tax=Centruroides vittatus TaxID=120091 RepID=UPI00350F3EEB
MKSLPFKLTSCFNKSNDDSSKMVPVPSPSPGPGTRGLVPSDNQLSYMMTPRNTMSITHTKGLLNMPGQNNCFLNSAVQVLWHLDIFRRSFRQLSGHTCMAESCIFCALKELFTQFQYSQESALPPDALRRALAETFCDQRRFQLGFMDDAAECFENILQRIHFHIASQQSEDMCSVAHCISHQKFAMVLIEQTCCHACGATSEPLPFTQMVHYVSASALCSQSSVTKQEYNKQSFGELLKRAGGMGDIRACPSSCGAKIQIRRVLINQPEIVSIGLVWDSERPTLEHIMEVFQTIGTVIHLTDIFHSVVDSKWAKTAMHQLVGVVTYYGKHYSTFFFHTKLRIWIYFDDATVREIGPSWDQVVEKCRRGHFQPLLLLYANPNGTPVSTTTAPRTVTLATNHKKKIAKITEATPSMHIPEHNAQTKKLAQLNNVPLRNVAPEVLMKEEYQNTKYPSFPLYHHVNIHHCQKHNTYSYNPSLPSSSCIKSCQCHHNHSSDHSVHSAHCHFVECENYQSVSQEKSLDVSNDQETYISRKAVESVLNFQKLQRQKSLSTIENRNSISSLDSFENQAQKPQLKLDIPDVENLSRRRDSGNWSGDRNSASSSSSTSIDNSYLFAIGNKWLHPPGFRHGIAGKANHDYINVFSDQGYDSFSLSSTDSYPSVGTTTMKLDPRLCQIPESLVLVDNKTACKQQSVSSVDCDKLCTEADLFLNKSHEKEQEGDLVMAALLSDLAASRARAAMDAPYSNSRSLVSAKMKHSTCVMRSSCLHRKLNEIETTEKRKQKEAEINHSRQSSRDSNHSRHVRQGSKGSKKSLSEGIDKSKKTIELYGTLPKKGSNRKDHYMEKSKDEQIYKDFLEKQRQSSKSEQQKQIIEKRKQFRTDGIGNNKTKSDIDTVADKPFSKIGIFEKSPSLRISRQRKSPPQQKIERKDSGFNENSNDWEHTKRPALFRTYSGPAAIKDMACEVVCQTNKKQHKIRQKLMGGFMRRKNRSLPDLREGQEISDQEARSYDDFALNIDNQTRKSNTEAPLPHISRVSHQPLRAYINKNVNQRPLLIRVSPPQVRAKSAKQLLTPFTVTSKAEAREVTGKSEISEDELPPPTNSFLAELQAKRKQIMKPKNEKETNSNQNEITQTNPLLQELQNKHHQMMEKRIQPLQLEYSTENQFKEKKKFDRSIPLTDNSQAMQKQENTFKNIEGNGISFSTENFTVNNSRPHDSMLQKEKELDSEAIEQKSCSVKDLASKFENIFCAKLQPQNSVRTSSLRNTSGEKTAVCNEEDKHVQHKQNSEIKLFNGNTNHLNDSSSFCDIPGHEESTKLDAIESNNQKIPGEPRRPIRPPDYETAVQRLCLLRDMALGEAEMKMAIGPDAKKKSGTKKTVTFSDKVVLVACADDDINDYLPNPVFERVYRQHIMQNFTANDEKTESSESANQQTILSCQQPQQNVIQCQPSQQTGILCQLCRKKFINMPTVYCSDCAFYMARFQPRQ